MKNGSKTDGAKGRERGTGGGEGGTTAGPGPGNGTGWGRSILEHGDLSVKYVSPAVPAVFYS